MRFVIEKNNCFVGIVDVFIVNLQVEVYERMPVSSRCYGIKTNANCKRPYRKNSQYQSKYKYFRYTFLLINLFLTNLCLIN